MHRADECDTDCSGGGKSYPSYSSRLITRVPYFSNPDYKFSGVSLDNSEYAIAMDKKNYHRDKGYYDEYMPKSSAEVFNENAKVVGSFRKQKSSPGAEAVCLYAGIVAVGLAVLGRKKILELVHAHADVMDDDNPAAHKPDITTPFKPAERADDSASAEVDTVATIHRSGWGNKILQLVHANAGVKIDSNPAAHKPEITTPFKLA